MPDFDLHNIDGLVERMRADTEGFLKDERAARQRHTLRQLQRLSPVDLGEFRASWTPWGAGGPGASRSRAQGLTTPATPADADASVEGLPIGADHGVSTSDPAAPALVRGLSPQAKPDFPVNAVRLASRASHREAAKGPKP